MDKVEVYFEVFYNAVADRRPRCRFEGYIAADAFWVKMQADNRVPQMVKCVREVVK